MSKNQRGGVSPEFWLLLLMLVSLVVLVQVVLYAPVIGTNTNLDAKAVLDYRSNLLSVILTAFGAWIGAGAAYFFGRENVREAYEGIRSLQQPSLIERMQNVKIQEIPPRVLEWTVGLQDTLGSIVDTLKKKPDFWFIPILEPDEKLKTVIEEEAIWRYYQDQVEKEGEADPQATLETIREKIIQKNVEDVLREIEPDKNYEKFIGRYVILRLDNNLNYANQQLEEKNVTLAIIVDTEDKARYFITTGDVRRAMAKL